MVQCKIDYQVSTYKKFSNFKHFYQTILKIKKKNTFKYFTICMNTSFMKGAFVLLYIYYSFFN